MAKPPSKLDAQRAMREAKFSAPVPRKTVPEARVVSKEESLAGIEPLPTIAPRKMDDHTPETKSQIRRKHAHGREGRAQLNVTLPHELLKELKIDAIDQGLTIEAWVEDAIRQELRARGQ